MYGSAAAQSDLELLLGRLALLSAAKGSPATSHSDKAGKKISHLPRRKPVRGGLFRLVS